MFDTQLLFFVFIFGAIIGSFINVLILRANTGRTIGGRSACMSCGKTLTALELIPIFSFLMQKGRCKGCGSSVSAQYIIVECTVGLLFVLAASVATSYAYLVCSFVLLPLLVAIAVYDARHFRIPNVWNYVFIFTSFVYFLSSQNSLKVSTDELYLFLIPASFFALWFFSKGRALGFGDVLFSIGIGFLLGCISGLYAVWIACMIGTVYGLAAIISSRIGNDRERVRLSSEIPFGPFLVLGTILVWLYGPIIDSLVSSVLFGI